MMSRCMIAMFILTFNLIHVSSKDFLVDLTFGSRPTTAEYACIKQSYDEIGLFIYSDQNGIQDFSRQAFINAKNAGLKVQIGMSPCMSNSYQDIINEFANTFQSNIIERIWVFPFSFVEGCEWYGHRGFSASLNCQYLINLLQGFRKKGFKTGVFTSRSVWKMSFGSQTACPEISNTPLAWSPIQQQQNGKPDFDLYRQIGGWTKPFMKQYDDTQVCGRSFMVFYYQ